MNVNFSLWGYASPDLKVLIKLFQKFADSKGGALVAPAGAKFSLRHFLFAKLFLLGLLRQKKKRGMGLSECNVL